MESSKLVKFLSSVIFDPSGLKFSLFVFTIFSMELCSRWILGGIGFDFYAYPVLIMVLLILPFVFSKKLLRIYTYIVLSTIVSILYLNLPLFPFIKQALGIFFVYFGTYSFLNHFKNDFERILDAYVNLAFVSAIFGIIQFFFSLIGINLLIKIPGHLDSIAYEPSHYCAIILPAVCLTLFQFRKYSLKAIILVLAVFLTKSFSGIVVLCIMLIIRNISFKNFVFIGSLGVFVLIFLSTNIRHFNLRYEGIKSIIEAKDYSTNTTSNGTAASLISNLDVALYTFRKSPIFGSGLGGHETMYLRKFKGTLFEDDWFFQLNKESAHSLTIRIFSELGLLGFTLFMIFFRNHFIKESLSKFHYIVFMACLSHFLCKTLKLGGYIDFGTPFFFCLIIINYKVFISKSNINLTKNE